MAKYYVSECPDTGRQFLVEYGKDGNIIELTAATVRRIRNEFSLLCCGEAMKLEEYPANYPNEFMGRCERCQKVFGIQDLTEISEEFGDGECFGDLLGSAIRN